MMTSLDDARVDLFLAVACRVVPEVAALSAEGRSTLTAIVDRALQDRPAGVRRQFALFLGVIRWLPAIRWGKTFDRLDESRRDRFLGWLQECPSRKLRQGFWGLKTLVFMGYYGRPEAGSEIGYATRRDATEMLHARA
jgi:hypothetical protein